jgi:hypothetical protein
MNSMKTYFGTKIVDAFPEDNTQGESGYAVIYEDNYRSWSPKDVFEKAYQPLDKLSFGHAVIAMKNGHRVSRAGWNGKGMFLYYVPAASYPAQRNTNSAMVGYYDNDMVPYRDYIAMKTAQNDVVPWVASQTDILADDWCVVD